MFEEHSPQGHVEKPRLDPLTHRYRSKILWFKPLRLECLLHRKSRLLPHCSFCLEFILPAYFVAALFP